MADDYSLEKELKPTDMSFLRVQDGDTVLSDTRNRDISVGKSILAGVASGIIIKPLEGLFSLGAELTDAFGLSTDAAARVEQGFDDISVLDEYAEATLGGQIFQSLSQLITLGGLGVKGINFALGASKKLAKKAVDAKKAGKYLDMKQWAQRAKNSPFSRGVVGIGVGQSFSADADELALFAEREEIDESSKDAQRQLKNRILLGTESIALGAAIGGLFKGVYAIRKAKGRGIDENEAIADLKTKVIRSINKKVTSKGHRTKGQHQEYRTKQQQMGAIKNDIEQLGTRYTEKLKAIFPSLKQAFSSTARKDLDEFEGIVLRSLGGDKKATSQMYNRLIQKPIGVRYEITKGRKVKGLGKVGAGKLRKITGKKTVEEKVLKVEDTKGLGMKKSEANILINRVKDLQTYTKTEIGRHLKMKTRYKPGEKVFTTKELKQHSKWRRELSEVSRKLKRPKYKNDPDLLVKKEQLNFKLQEVAEKKVGYVYYGAARKQLQEGFKTFVPFIRKAALSMELKGDITKKLFSFRPSAEIKQNFINSVNATRTSNYLGPMPEKEINQFIEEILTSKELLFTGRIPAHITKKLGIKGKEVSNALNPTAKQIHLYEPEVEALLGRVNDPVANYVEAVGRIAGKRTDFEFLEAAGKIGIKTQHITPQKTVRNNILYKTPKGQLPTSASRGYIEGGVRKHYYISKDFKEGLLDPIPALNINMQSWLGGSYGLLMLAPKAFAQSMKTVASGVTHVRNFISAGAFAMANANFTLTKNPLTQYPRYSKTFKEAFLTKGRGSIDDTPLWGGALTVKKFNDQYTRYLELGVVNTNVRLGDLRGLLKDIGQLSILKGQAGSSETLLGRLTHPFRSGYKGVYKWAERQYQAEDDFWKIINFHGEMDKYRMINPNWTQAQLERHAAKIVRDNVPNYDMVPQIIKDWRRTPFGNFISFPAEMMRTSGNIMELALKERAQGIQLIKQGKALLTAKSQRQAALLGRAEGLPPKNIVKEGRELIRRGEAYKKVGTQRMSGFAYTVAGLPASIQTAAKLAYNVSEEEMMALRRFVPEWSKNSTLIPIRDKETGELKYMDLSYSLAFDVISRPAMTIVNAIANGIEDDEALMQGLVEGLSTSVVELYKPFTEESIFSKALFDVVLRNGKQKDGRPVWNEADPLGEKMSKSFIHAAWKPLQPGSIAQFKRIIKHSGDDAEPDLYGRTFKLKNEIPGLMGFRMVEPDPGQGLLYKVSAFNKQINGAQKAWFSDVNRGKPMTAEEIYKQWAGAQRARFEAMREMYKDIDAAGTLNIGFSDFNKQVERISDEDLKKAVLHGYFKAYAPSEKTLQPLYDKAKAAGWGSELARGMNMIKFKTGETNNIPLLGENPFDWWEKDDTEQTIPKLNTTYNYEKLKEVTVPIDETGVSVAEALQLQESYRKAAEPIIETASKLRPTRFTRDMAVAKTKDYRSNVETLRKGKELFPNDIVFSKFKEGGEIKKYAKGGEVKAEEELDYINKITPILEETEIVKK